MIDKRSVPTPVTIRLGTQLIRRPDGAFYRHRCILRGARNFAAETSFLSGNGRAGGRKFGRSRGSGEECEKRYNQMDRAESDLHCCFSDLPFKVSRQTANPDSRIVAKFKRVKTAHATALVQFDRVTFGTPAESGSV